MSATLESLPPTLLGNAPTESKIEGPRPSTCRAPSICQELPATPKIKSEGSFKHDASPGSLWSVGENTSSLVCIGITVAVVVNGGASENEIFVHNAAYAL